MIDERRLRPCSWGASAASTRRCRVNRLGSAGIVAPAQLEVAVDEVRVIERRANGGSRRGCGPVLGWRRRSRRPPREGEQVVERDSPPSGRLALAAREEDDDSRSGRRRRGRSAFGTARGGARPARRTGRAPRGLEPAVGGGRSLGGALAASVAFFWLRSARRDPDGRVLTLGAERRVALHAGASSSSSSRRSPRIASRPARVQLPERGGVDDDRRGRDRSSRRARSSRTAARGERPAPKTKSAVPPVTPDTIVSIASASAGVRISVSGL